ncbi:MAG: putative HTH-type transcriptional regulator ywhA [Chloroflexi bacterium]|jgi:DNA-binding MarR family transcriptional regulator|nr:putative HTH-type transcriptional regulator ywhA [Chloroflexota bacterium]
MAGVKPLDQEQILNVRDFIMFLGEKFKRSTEDFEGFSKCSIQEIIVLKILANQGSIMVKDIACRLTGISMSSLTRILDHLEENEYIERKLNKEDRRSFVIALSPKGSKLAESYQNKFEVMAEGMLEALTPAERLILVELYTKVRSKLGDEEICLSKAPKSSNETAEELKV